MSCSSPKAAAPCPGSLDPSKRVNYTLGMVLGVDDFLQEHAFLSGRDKWLARDLIGYGTECGLAVAVETDANGPRVVVSPGVAVTPRGQKVRVPAAQCAALNDWIAAHPEATAALPGSPLVGALALNVVLCYRDCPTDPLPIPGEPCRSEDDAMAPSRVVDDFRLELRLAAPDQAEEDAVRAFSGWVDQVEFTDDPTLATPEAEVEAFIRLFAATRGAPTPGSPLAGSPLAGSPLGSPLNAPLVLESEACQYLRTAFRIWVTELRPLWPGNGQGCAAGRIEEGCILLASLVVPVAHVATLDAWRVDDLLPVIVDEEHRPYLVHLRMLQERLLCARHGGGEAGAKGPTGNRGPTGDKGPPGDKGQDGKDGKNGIDGKDGKNGIDGKNGTDGKNGIDGKNGTNGKDGVDGKNGVDGKDGKDGVDGKDGSQFIVAAARFDMTGNAGATAGFAFGTEVKLITATKGQRYVFLLKIPSFDPKVPLVVKGTVVIPFFFTGIYVFEVVDPFQQGDWPANLVAAAKEGVLVRVRTEGTSGQEPTGVMVEISRFA